MAHLKKSKTNHLVWHPSYATTLKFASDKWYSRTVTRAAFTNYASQTAPNTPAGINTSPASLYSTIYGQVKSALTTTNNGSLMLQASVGSAYNNPGPARVTLFGTASILTIPAPSFKVTSARVSGSGGGYGGLFSSWPSGGSLMASGYRSDTSKITFTAAEITMLNNAASGTNLYFGLGALPPPSFSGSLASYSVTNDGEEGDYIKGYWVEAGGTLTWLVGNMTFPSNPSISLGLTLELQF